MDDLIKQAAADIVRRRDDAETIERMFRDAIARERERCAKIAEARGAEAELMLDNPVAAAARGIASKIRAQK